MFAPWEWSGHVWLVSLLALQIDTAGTACVCIALIADIDAATVGGGTGGVEGSVCLPAMLNRWLFTILWGSGICSSIGTSL